MQYEHDLPPGVVLLVTKILDSIPFLSNDWRNAVPFGWAEAPTGFLSHHVPPMIFPPLKEYSDVPGGWYQFISTKDTVLGDLTHPVSIGVALMMALILHTLKFALYPGFQRVGTTMAIQTHGAKWVRDNPVRIYKFAEYCFRLLFHSFISLYGLWIFSRSDWWHASNGGTMNFYVGYPNHEMGPDVIWYCLIQAAYNIDAIISLVLISFSVKVDVTRFPFATIGWSETARGDFTEMFVHHVATNLLIFEGSAIRISRSMMSMNICHDISDIPIDLSKLANFVKWKKTTVVCFISMMVVWIITRLTIVPFVIYKSLLFESYAIVTQGIYPPVIYYCYKSIFVVFVGLIIALHVFWFATFLQILYVLVSKGEPHDLSEHKQGEKRNSTKQD